MKTLSTLFKGAFAIYALSSSLLIAGAETSPDGHERPSGKPALCASPPPPLCMFTSLRRPIAALSERMDDSQRGFFNSAGVVSNASASVAGYAAGFPVQLAGINPYVRVAGGVWLAASSIRFSTWLIFEPQKKVSADGQHDLSYPSMRMALWDNLRSVGVGGGFAAFTSFLLSPLHGNSGAAAGKRWLLATASAIAVGGGNFMGNKTHEKWEKRSMELRAKGFPSPKKDK